MENKQKREAEIRKMVQQLNEKARMLIESTQSSSHLGMPLEQRVKRLEDLKFSAVGLLNETIQVLTEEGYANNRELMSYCFQNMTAIEERLNSAIRAIKSKPNG